MTSSKNLAVLVLFASTTLAPLGAQTAPPTPRVWVGSWASAQQVPEPNNSLAPGDYKDATLRQIVHLSVGGIALRVHLSNAFGYQALHVTAVHIAKPLSATGPAIDPATDMILASAVYFKAHWAKEFEPYLTKPKAFHLDATRTVTVPMMSVTHSWLYLRGDGFQAVQLPYKDSFLAMEVLLPDTTSSPEQLLTALDAKTWQKHIATGLVSKKGTILLPRFKLAQTTDLRQPLQTLGVHGAFDSSANFSALSDDSLYISRVLKKSYIQVDEAGTEAGAVTETWLTKGGDYDPEPFEMVMDLPFLFFITDTRSGTILFMGAIHDPSQAE